MPDWTETDISRISEKDFPVRCDRCGHELTGLGESGQCPSCDLPFSRRLRLWQTYGPEAFAEPPITPAEQEASRKDNTFVSALLTALIVTFSLPLVLLAWLAVFGTIDLCFCLFVWAVLVSAVTWLAVVRRVRKTQADVPGRETKTNVHDGNVETSTGNGEAKAD